MLLLCLVCSVVVAGSAVGLKSKQQEQKLLDKQRNILDVAGLLQPKMESEQVKRLYSERIEPRPVDLNSGEFVAGKAAAFDLGAALRDDAKSVALAAGDDPAGIKRRSNQAEIYRCAMKAAGEQDCAAGIRHRPVVDDVRLRGAG